MVETKLCDNKKMNCDDNGCIYSETPEGEFAWNKNQVFVNFECKFYKKHIVGDKLNMSIYSTGLSSCKPTDYFCRLYDSTVVWSELSVKKCPFKRIYYGQRFMRKGNLIFSRLEQYLFQITTNFKFDDLTMFSTTDGLYLVFEPDHTSKAWVTLSNIPINANDQSLLTQRDINDLMLAEADYSKYSIEEDIYNEHERN